MELRHIAVNPGRLSAILKGEMGLSTGLMNRLKWQNRLFVNGQPQFTNYPVQPGDVVTALVDDPEPEYPPETGELTVLYEDDHLLAVDKPAGMLIHPSRARNTGTLANLVLGYYRCTGQPCAFHPLTRLDRDTYGLVLLAKNAHVHALLNELHTQGRICKLYHALVFGGPEETGGSINAPIGRLPKPSLLRQVDPAGKPACTEFAVLARYDGFTKLQLRPVTGRTHQLRIHCAHRGFPILGDPQYGSEASAAFSRELGLHTQVLCAKSLELPHPVTGQPLGITSRMEALPFSVKL